MACVAIVGPNCRNLYCTLDTKSILPTQAAPEPTLSHEVSVTDLHQYESVLKDSETTRKCKKEDMLRIYLLSAPQERGHVSPDYCASAQETVNFLQL